MLPPPSEGHEVQRACLASLDWCSQLHQWIPIAYRGVAAMAWLCSHCGQVIQDYPGDPVDWSKLNG